MTTTTLPRRISLPFRTPRARRSFAIGFVATLAVGVLALTAASAAIGLTSRGEVLPGVSVGGVDLTGMDRQAAAARLSAELPSLSIGTATIVADGVESVITFEELNRGYEIEAMVDAAFAVGRSGGILGDGIDRLRALAHDTELPIIVHAYDPGPLDTAAAAVARAVSHHPVEARVTVPGYEVAPAADGRLLTADAVRAALLAPLASTSPDDIRIELTTTAVAPVVSTEEATAAAEAARAATAAGFRFAVPAAGEDERPLAVPAETIASWISFGPQGAEDYAMRIDDGAVRTWIAGLADDVNREPVSARIGVAGTGLGGVIPGVEGRVLEVEASTDGVLGALAERVAGAEIKDLNLAVTVTEPPLTTAEAEAILPQMRLVSSWTTYYVPGDGNGFGNNISIGAWDLDGYNIAPGEWFSFWNGIGPVTVERGYRYGGVIIGGRSLPTGALAGGICSTSTTLFNAAMRFGLEIGERTAHYYYIDRYPTGLDATVAIVDNSVTDMTFRNDTENPIVIRGFGTPGQVTFQLWSVPNGRTVALSSPVISDRRSAIETTQVDTSMAPGTARRVEYPHDGFKVSVSRTVYAADGSVVHQNTWFSDYRVVNGITLVGPTPASAPEPPPDEDDGDTAGAGDPAP
jgi:vancomycin resistance protein YoaR